MSRHPTLDRSLIPCACGCGTLIPRHDAGGHSRQYVSREHRWKPKPTENPLVSCGCGCGELMRQYDSRNRPRQTIYGHWSRLQPNYRTALTCEYCGAPIERARWQLNPANVAHHFCDGTCAGKWASEQGIRRGSQNGYYHTITVACGSCGVPVSKAASLINRRNGRVYCPVCIPKIVRRGRKGFYVGYPPEFSAKLRTEVRKRDSYTCQLCDKAQKGTGTLCVHHIDYNTQHNGPQNLISLCRVCHGLTNFGLATWTTRLQALMCARFP